MFYKIPDSIPSNSHRFTPKKPFDAILLDKGFNALEFKSAPLRTYKQVKAPGPIRFDALKPHQEEALLRVEELGHTSYVVCFFGKEYIMIRIKDFIKLRGGSKKKSFRLEEARAFLPNQG